MAGESDERARALVACIDEALAGAASLTEEQLDDVEGLRATVIAHCRAGRWGDAEAGCSLALTIVRSGAPVPE